MWKLKSRHYSEYKKRCTLEFAPHFQMAHDQATKLFLLAKIEGFTGAIAEMRVNT